MFSEQAGGLIEEHVGNLRVMVKDFCYKEDVDFDCATILARKDGVGTPHRERELVLGVPHVSSNLANDKRRRTGKAGNNADCYATKLRGYFTFQDIVCCKSGSS